MRLPAFDNDHRAWDQYELFHCHRYDRLFTQFEGGELRLNTFAPDPDYRTEYDALGLRVVGTRDRDMPQLYDQDGVALPKAWLYRDGMQYLVIDMETGKAYSTASYNYDFKQQVPNHLRRAGMAWLGAGQEPLVHGTIKASSPSKELTTEVRRNIKDAQALASATSRIMGEGEEEKKRVRNGGWFGTDSWYFNRFGPPKLIVPQSWLEMDAEGIFNYVLSTPEKVSMVLGRYGKVTLERASNRMKLFSEIDLKMLTSTREYDFLSINAEATE